MEIQPLFLFEDIVVKIPHVGKMNEHLTYAFSKWVIGEGN